MKYLKMLGLAAVAAMALTAFLGASSASATVLCKTSLTTGCHAAGWAYPSGTTIDASVESGTKATLETLGGLIRDECSESTVKGSTTTTGSSSETIKGTVETANLSFGGCTATTDVLEGGELEVHWIAGTDNGTLTAKKFQVTVVIGGESCIYGTGTTGTDLGTVTGGSMATIDVSATVTKQAGSGANCTSTSNWTAKYTVTSPEPLTISES
jgi:hypothetical protein